MSLTDDFLLASQAFASKYVVLVNESGNPNKQVSCTKVQPMKVGKVQQDPADNMIFTFTMERITGGDKTSWNQVSCQIADLPMGNTGMLQKCYLLPFQRNETTQMRLGNKADYFFTSTLCGCTVQVDGNPTNPRVAHANAGDLYGDTYTSSRKICPYKKASQIHQYAENRADIAAQGRMQSQLPTPTGGSLGTVTKADYLAHFTKHNLKTAKEQFITEADYRISSITPNYGKGGHKPSIGAFVFGKKNMRDEWTFFYQANIEVDGHTKRGKFFTSKKKMFYEAIVLGPAIQFYP